MRLCVARNGPCSGGSREGLHSRPRHGPWSATGKLCVLGLMLAAGCAHSPLSASALDRVEKPAFVSRIEPGAGAKSSVFRSDSSYKDKLKTLSASEADKRLSEKLTNGTEDTAGNKVPSMNRFQIADTLRSHTLARLPKDPPWTNAAKPGDVAAALQSFLVQEEGAAAPDYEQLRAMGVDAIVE